MAKLMLFKGDGMLKENVIRKLKATIKEFGVKAVEGVTLIGPSTVDWKQLNGYRYIPCATLAEVKLGNVTFEVARFFEDAK